MDHYNFLLAGYFLTKVWESFNLYIKIIYPKFAPILRSQKKVDFLCSGSTLHLHSSSVLLALHLLLRTLALALADTPLLHGCWLINTTYVP